MPTITERLHQKMDHCRKLVDAGRREAAALGKLATERHDAVAKIRPSEEDAAAVEAARAGLFATRAYCAGLAAEEESA